MGGGDGWVTPEANEREFLTFDAVKMLVDLGVNVNAKNTDGRTALDAAKALRYDSVIKLLTGNLIFAYQVAIALVIQLGPAPLGFRFDQSGVGSGNSGGCFRDRCFCGSDSRLRGVDTAIGFRR